MNRSAVQKGQAMVFGLIFMAACILILLSLYNQGQLVRSRLQIENAADAAVYTQAKLAARNANFIAYTNRAMVSNEVSIGQMVSLISWARAYADIPKWIDSFPLYQTPIIPPSPVTYGMALKVASLPYILMGNAIGKPVEKMTSIWPKVVSYFNLTLGVFQKMFVLATLEAQIEMTLAVIDDHELTGPAGPRDELYMPVIGWFYLMMNNLLTYFAGEFSPDTLINKAAAGRSAGEVSAAEMAGEFLGEQGLTINSFIESHTPAKIKRGGTVVNDSEEAYQRFSAIVNLARDDFTRNRESGFRTPKTPDIFPEIPLPVIPGILTLYVDLDVQVEFGTYKDGGTAYGYNMFAVGDQKLQSYGWSGIDLFGLGFTFFLGLQVEAEFCFPGFGCDTAQIIDLNFDLPLVFPLGGATHQVVRDLPLAKKVILEWGFPYIDKVNPITAQQYGDVFIDLTHVIGMFWGAAMAPTPPGMYGANPLHVDATYGGPPAFMSLGSSFQTSKKSYEFTVAVAKKLQDVRTTDSPNHALQIEPDTPIDPAANRTASRTTADGVPTYARVTGLKTYSGAQSDDLKGGYKKLAWGLPLDGDETKPMMTISSAEIYYRDGGADANPSDPEIASLFNPYWDARLKEPSWITVMIATGEIPWHELIPGFNANSAASWVARYILDKIGSAIVDSAVEYAKKKVDPPMNKLVPDVLEPPLTDLKDAGVDAAMKQIDDSLGVE